MAIFLQKRQVITNPVAQLRFSNPNERLSGFGFPCDDDGNVDVNALKIAARENYEKCVAGTMPNVSETPWVWRYSEVYTEPAIIECDNCHRPVTLGDGLTNECECEALYNGIGERLVPRQQWEEN